MGSFFTILVPGTPVGKGRPRFDPASGKARTPKKTRGWEKTFAWCARAAAMKSKWDCKGEEPVSLSVTAVFKRPQRMKGEYREWRQGVPDGDNILKAIADGLQKAGIVKNDTQIVDWGVRCVYGAPSEQGHLEIEVRRAPQYLWVLRHDVCAHIPGECFAMS